MLPTDKESLTQIVSVFYEERKQGDCQIGDKTRLLLQTHWRNLCAFRAMS